MSHAMHISEPNFLVYQFLAPQVNKKPAAKVETKTAPTVSWLESHTVTDPNRERDSDDRDSGYRDSDGEGSGGGLGFDLTV
jgi:hypothetical protein